MHRSNRRCTHRNLIPDSGWLNRQQRFTPAVTDITQMFDRVQQQRCCNAPHLCLLRS
jgi:hypothetical protein